jgi:hypothetical protein
LQAWGLKQLASVYETALALWRANGYNKLPFVRVIKYHATPGHGTSTWLAKLANARGAALPVDESTAQQLRALGGVHARLMALHQQQPHRFQSDPKRGWLCMPLLRGDTARFGEQRTQSELFAAATAGRDAAHVRRQLGLPS